MRSFVMLLVMLMNMLMVNRIASMNLVETKISHEVQQPFSTNTLLIFLDDSEKEMGSISRALLEALRQTAAPVLTSISLLRIIILTSKDSFFKSDFEKAWVIKLVNPDLALLIPKDYSSSMEKQYGAVAHANSFSKLEAVLGLQIDHMKTVPSIHDYIEKWESSEWAFGFLENLDKIFIPRAAYAPKKADKDITLTDKFVPTWSIFATGHGTLDKSIIGISIKEFPAFLEFLTNKINTKLLVYFSCYAAGTNAALIYKNLTDEIGDYGTTSSLYKSKTYPYVIATGALTDAPTSAAALFFNFKEFVRQVTAPDNGDYTKMLMPVLRSAQGMVEQKPESRSDTRSDIRNVPQLKLPGIPWFNVVDTTKKVVSIGKILAQTRSQDLDVVSYFKINKPLGILLYTTYIPFTLHINLDAMPPLIMMEPGDIKNRDKIVYIKGITVNGTFDNFLKAFDIIKESGVKRTFLIDSLTVEANRASKQTFENLIIDFSIIGFDLIMTAYKFNISETGITGAQYNIKSQKWDALSDAWADRQYKDFLYVKKNDPAFEEIFKKIDEFQKIQNSRAKQVKTEAVGTVTSAS